MVYTIYMVNSNSMIGGGPYWWWYQVGTNIWWYQIFGCSRKIEKRLFLEKYLDKRVNMCYDIFILKER